MLEVLVERFFCALKSFIRIYNTIYSLKMVSTSYLLCSLRLHKLNLNWRTNKVKQYKQKTSSKKCKTEIKILANPGLTKSGFEQPSPDVSF